MTESPLHHFTSFCICFKIEYPKITWFVDNHIHSFSPFKWHKMALADTSGVFTTFSDTPKYHIVSVKWMCHCIPTNIPYTSHVLWINPMESYLYPFAPCFNDLACRIHQGEDHWKSTENHGLANWVFLKMRLPKLDGLRENPSKNGWFGTSPISGHLQTCIFLCSQMCVCFLRVFFRLGTARYFESVVTCRKSRKQISTLIVASKKKERFRNFL